MTKTGPIAAGNAELQAQLDQLGIRTVPKAVYEWRGYRYSSASDAIAAAERAAR
jgi:hypothetical protein